MKRSILAAIILLGVLAPATAGAEPPDGEGTNTTETRDTGAPTDPNAWGSVVSQVAGPQFGQHASDPTPGDDQPRLGVGNVAANDGGTGTRPSDHAFVVGPSFGADPTAKPGKR